MDYWKGNKIRLRRIKSSDIELWNKFDDAEDKFVDVIHFPQSTETKAKWIERELIAVSEGDSFRWIAEDMNQIPVGTINTFSCDRRHGTFKYAVVVGKPFRGKGFAKEMVLMVLKYYFMELGYQKVTLNVYSFNENSLKFHEQLGIIKEGQLRSMIYGNGKYHDEIYLGMTRLEFEKKHSEL